VGRPAKHRRAIARSFVAKAIYNMSHTRELLERLAFDPCLRRIRGWEKRREVPHESQFSRAFSVFSATELPQRLHLALIEATQKKPSDRSHIARLDGNRRPREASAYAGGNRARQDDAQTRPTSQG